MKSPLIACLLGGAVYLASCSNNNNATTEETKDTTSSATTTSSTTPASSENDKTYSNVPQATRTSFETKYPQANNVKWESYNPTDTLSDEWMSDWMTNMDTTDYQVNFNWDGMDYIAYYDNGDWIGSTARMTDNSKLPKAVNDAIHERYGNYTIKEVDKENDKNKTVYEVEMENGKDKMKVHFDENGNALKAKGKVAGQKVKAKEDTK